MASTTAFFAGLALLLLTSGGALLLVQRPLVAILLELCGSDRRALFWSRLYGVTLFLFVGLLALSAPPSPADERTGFHAFLPTFRAGITALLLGLGALAFILLFPIASHDRRQAALLRSGAGKGH
jgi:uncharacterized membrane protein YdcZ (DUF606 family)